MVNSCVCECESTYELITATPTAAPTTGAPSVAPSSAPSAAPTTGAPSSAPTTATPTSPTTLAPTSGPTVIYKSVFGSGSCTDVVGCTHITSNENCKTAGTTLYGTNPNAPFHDTYASGIKPFGCWVESGYTRFNTVLSMPLKYSTTCSKYMRCLCECEVSAAAAATYTRAVISGGPSYNENKCTDVAGCTYMPEAECSAAAATILYFNSVGPPAYKKAHLRRL